MPAKIVSIAQQKGGAGKTTLAAHLAVHWARGGRRVAVVDIDPQQSLATWFDLRAGRHGPTAGLDLSSIQGWRTRGEVERLARDHDLVLIDSPPHADTEARLAVRAADLVLVPVQPSPMDLWASRPTVDMATKEGTRALVTLNRMPARGQIALEMAEEAKRLGVDVARARIGNRVLFAAAMAAGLTAEEVEAGSRAAEEIARLAAEIERGLDRKQAG